jgi:hypothetical protein
MALEKALRRENLLRILESDFDGNRNQLASKLHIAIPTLNKYIAGGKTHREMSNKKARQFERSLRLSPGTLDHKQTSETNIYYVKIGFSGSRVNKLLEKLYAFEIIQEASAQYGATDIFLKIEASEEELRKLVFEQIRAFPGVSSTSTAQVLAHSHWQREQLHCYDIYEDESSPSDLLATFIQAKNRTLYKEIEALEKGEKIIIGESDYHSIDYLQLLSRTHGKVRITKRFKKHFKTDDIKKFEADFYQEQQKISADSTLNCLIIIDKATPEKSQKELKKILDNVSSTKNKAIRVMREDIWIRSRYQHEAEHFTIFAQQLVSIMERKSITLRYNPSIVEHYIKVFQRNWINAAPSGYWDCYQVYD